MKTLKFREKLSKLILKGKKTATWRLFDDKDLKKGDIVKFLVRETKEEFAKVKLTSVKETRFGNLTEKDWEGHEKYGSDEEIYAEFSKYYKRPVDENSPVKILRFIFI